MPASALADGRIALLALLLIVAAVIDYRSLRIPNWLTAGGTVLGLALNAVGGVSALAGFLWALAGAAVACAVLLPAYVFRVMGAGDVKLMAMVGAFLGLPQILPALLFVFVTGGVSALLFAVAHRRVGRLAFNFRNIVQGMVLPMPQPLAAAAPDKSIGKLPYAVSIGAGTLLYLASRQLGYL